MTDIRCSLTIPAPIIFGGGGHALTVIDDLGRMGVNVGVCIDPNPIDSKSLTLFSSLDELPSSCLQESFLVCIGDIEIRKQVFAEAEKVFKNPYTYISSSAQVSKMAQISTGCQILPSSIVEVGALVGSNSIINVGSSIHHGSSIGSFCNISPGARILGNVRVGNQVLVGSNAVVFPGVKIGDNAKIGAGAIVRKDVADLEIVY